jgi:hypothetical protein
MPDKIIRISAEDNGVTEKVQRIGQSIREAFGKADMIDIIDEADKKFTTLGDKIKFIKEELENIKSTNVGAYNEEVSRLTDSRNGYSTGYVKPRLQALETGLTSDNKVIDDLVESLKNLNKNIEEGAKNGEQEAIPGSKPKLISGDDSPYTSALRDLISGNVTGAKDRMLQHGMSQAGESLSGLGETLGKHLMTLGGLIAAGVSGAVLLARQGYEEQRGENQVRRGFDVDSDFGDSSFLSRVGLSRSEFREKALSIALSRRSGANMQTEALQRQTLENAYPIQDQDIAGFDRFYKMRNDGTMSDKSGMDAVRTITDILARSERQGILGVSQQDFTMLPEKIGQVQAIMGMQFGNGERTNAADAVNMMLAGDKIGGRFSDSRLSEVMGRIDGSIKNPSGPGMRAFLFNQLRNANPGASYTDILGQMENGASGQNLQAILPTISNMPQGELRRMVLFQLTKNMQDAIRLDQSGNLGTMLNQLKQSPISDEEAGVKFGNITNRNDKLTTEWDRSVQWLKNELGNISQNVAKGVDWLFKHSPSSLLPNPIVPLSGSPWQDNYFNENVITEGSPTGNQVKR